MTKIKKWRLVLVTILAALAVFMVGFALHLGVFTSVKAEQICEGNTADYTFENDLNNPWTWDKENNTWQSDIKEMKSTATILTLNATKAGNVVFEYRASSEAKFDWLCIMRISKGTSTVLVGADKKNYESDKCCGDNKEYTSMTVSVELGDKITFKYEKDSSGDYFDDSAFIHGLKYNDTLHIAVESEGNGSVAIQGNESNVIDVAFYSGSATLNATAEGKNTFAFWKDNNGKICSYSETFKVVNPVSDVTYTAVFFDGEEYFYGSKNDSGEEQWAKTEDGGNAYSVDFTKVSAQPANVTLSWIFTGETYFTFNFAFSTSSSAASATVSIDGETVWYLGYGTFGSKEELEWWDVILRTRSEGRHYVQFTMSVKGNEQTDFPFLEFKNIQKATNLSKTNVEINYDTRLGEVYMDDELVVPGQREVIIGYEYHIQAKEKAEVNSTVDPLQKTKVRFLGFQTRSGEWHKLKYDKADDPSEYFSGRGKSSSYYTGDYYYFYNDNKLTNTSSQEGEYLDGSYIYARFEEIALAPQTVNVQIFTNASGQAEKSHNISSGEIVEIPYSETNKVIVNIDDFPKIAEEYEVYFNDEDEPADVNFLSEDGKNTLVLQDLLQDTTLYIGYYTDNLNSSPWFAINFHIVLDGGISNIIQSDSLEMTIENDDVYPWNFDPIRTTGKDYAFMAGNSKYNPEGSYNLFISNLAFNVSANTAERDSVLAFEFYLKGRNKYVYAMYNLDTPVEIGEGWKTFEGIGATKGFNLAGAISGDNGSLSSYVTELGDDWYSAVIPVSRGTQRVYIAYGNENNSSNVGMAIRKVSLLQGEATVSWEVQDIEGHVTATDNQIAVTANGEAVSLGDVALGTMLNFAATPESKSGNQLLAWANSEGKLLSLEEEFSYFVGKGEHKIIAIIDNPNYANFRRGGKFYKTLKAAVEDKSNKEQDIIVCKNVTVTENVTIPVGINVILPIEIKSGLYYAEGTTTTATPRVSWAAGSYMTPVVKLTVDKTATITIEGSLYVGGVLHYPDQSAQAHTSGKYCEIALDGQINVAFGGKLDVYGRITGDGGITVKSGGALYQPFLIVDYSGGTNTQDLFGLDQTPFKRYAMVNIQCGNGYTIEYGGELYGHASLYFWSSVTTIDQPFISYVGEANGKDGTTTLINLKKDAIAHVVYDDKHAKIPDTQNNNNTVDIGHTTITITGGATAGYMSFPLGINTKNVAFSIPYNYALVLENGTYDMQYDYKLMPGASLIVTTDATLNIDAKFYVYDGLIQTAMSGKTYPTAAELIRAGYSTNANFIVNGTLNINQGATFLGVIQTTDTTGKARIVVASDGDDEKLKVTLDGTIVDGGNTDYDCNYAEYESSARVWIKTADGKGKLFTLEKGKTYASTYQAQDATWGVKDISITYESASGKHNVEANHNKLTTGTLTSVEGLKGSWMEEHGKNHVFDWNPAEAEKNDTIFDGGNATKITHYCTVPGCTESAEKHLLKSGLSLSKTYNGTTYDKERLFEELYGALKDEVGATITIGDGLSTIKDVREYTIIVKLENGFFLVGGEFKDEATFTLEIQKKALTVTILDQSKDYDGSAPTASTAKGTGYEAADLEEGDTLNVTFNFSGATSKNAGDYEMTATVENGNYDITVSYQHEDHAIFTINKIQLTVTIGGSSPQNEELKYTITVDGYIAADRELYLLGENGEEWKNKVNISGVEKENEPNTYDLSLSWKDGAPELDNYNVVLKDGCKYTITDPVFGEIKFTLDGTEQTSETFETVYDGKEHTVGIKNADGMSVDWSGAALTQTDADTYTITATVSTQEYQQEYTLTFTIKKLAVTVELKEQSREYNGLQADPSTAQGTAWILADGTELADADGGDALGIAFTVDDNGAAVKTYTITATANGKNYDVTFKNGQNTTTFEIKPKTLTVTINTITTTYGEGDDDDAIKAAHANSFSVDESALVTVNGVKDKVAITLDFSAVDLRVANPDGYTVTGNAAKGAENNDNYNIVFTGGVWKVNKRQIIVVIAPVSATYDGEEPAAPTEWALKSGSTLASWDHETDLVVVLTKEEGFDAGSYDIIGSWTNDNYEVTFEGETDGYTIDKLDVTSTGDFIIMAGEQVSGNDTLETKYAGEEITITGYVLLDEGAKQLNVTLSQDKITGVGNFDVTVTVNETNYKGSKVLHVIVTNADGYTQRLIETLAELAELTDGMTAETLTAEDFAALKQVLELISALNEDEKIVGATALAPYEALVTAWNEAAEEDIDGVIEAAHSVGGALLNGLFSVASIVSAFAVAAYVFGKGGLL